LRQMGINPQSQSMLTDFVRRMRQLPEFLSYQIGGMFGFDPRTLLMLMQGLPEFEEAQRKSLNMWREMGVDPDEAAKASRDLMNMWREVWARITALAGKLNIDLLPVFQQINEIINQALINFSAWMNSKEVKDFIDRLVIILREMASGNMQGFRKGFSDLLDFFGSKVKDIGRYIFEGFKDAVSDWLAGKKEQLTGLTPAQAAAIPTGPNPEEMAAGTTTAESLNRLKNWASNQWAKMYAQLLPENPQELFSTLEQQYGLPPGFLNRLWMTEAGGRAHPPMSAKGAVGPAQIIPATGAEWGVTNPEDFRQAMLFAARYTSYLREMFGGNLQAAVAAYNAGPGTIQNVLSGRGALPAETQAYLGKMGMSMTFHTTVNVTGAAQPEATANAVSSAVRRTFGDLTRDMASMYGAG